LVIYKGAAPEVDENEKEVGDHDAHDGLDDDAPEQETKCARIDAHDGKYQQPDQVVLDAAILHIQEDKSCCRINEWLEQN
jgi:hypothetical protein